MNALRDATAIAAALLVLASCRTAPRSEPAAEKGGAIAAAPAGAPAPVPAILDYKGREFGVEAPQPWVVAALCGSKAVEALDDYGSLYVVIVEARGPSLEEASRSSSAIGVERAISADLARRIKERLVGMPAATETGAWEAFSARCVKLANDRSFSGFRRIDSSWLETVGPARSDSAPRGVAEFRVLTLFGADRNELRTQIAVVLREALDPGLAGTEGIEDRISVAFFEGF